ncbi:MAG TPA: S9 family peptidase, partial [Planctomycetes bacterium]|nr:S9 family peptidase [Planctomycetota bacterium]
MTMRTNVLLLSLSILASSSSLAQDVNLVYPQTKTVPQHDDFHGTKVDDPYRWLEDDVRESKDVAAWVEAQNKLTFDYLKKIPGRDNIEE